MFNLEGVEVLEKELTGVISKGAGEAITVLRGADGLLHALIPIDESLVAELAPKTEEAEEAPAQSESESQG